MQRVVGGNGHRGRRCHVHPHERSVCLFFAGLDGMLGRNAVIVQYLPMSHNSMEVLDLKSLEGKLPESVHPGVQEC